MRPMPRSVAADVPDDDDRGSPGWTFLTNHGHVLVCIALDPDVLLSEIAEQVGIRERAAHRIVSELVDAGYVHRERVGRRNHYTIDPGRPLRHPLEREHIIGELLGAVATPPRKTDSTSRPAVATGPGRD
jgi:DNA-binding transcriptional ArsR family regulator